MVRYEVNAVMAADGPGGNQNKQTIPLAVLSASGGKKFPLLPHVRFGAQMPVMPNASVTALSVAERMAERRAGSREESREQKGRSTSSDPIIMLIGRA